MCRQFIVLCRRLALFGQTVAAIDGSKFKAVNNRDKNFTKAKLKKRMEANSAPSCTASMDADSDDASYEALSESEQGGQCSEATSVAHRCD